MNWFFYAFISALFSAASALFQKKALQHFNAFVFCLILSGFNLILTLPFLLKSPWNLLSASSLALVVFKSLINAFGFFSVMRGLQTLELGRGLPLLALTPFFVYLGGLAFLGESLGLMEILGLLLICSGTFLLEFKETQKRVWFSFEKHGAIALALIFMTANTLLDRYIVGPLKLPPSLVLSVTQICFLIFFIVLIPFQHFSLNDTRDLFKKFWWLPLTVALFTLVYRYTNLVALSLAPAALVITIKRSSIFFAMAIGGKVFKEGHYLKRLMASLLLVAGTMLLFRYGG